MEDNIRRLTGSAASTSPNKSKPEPVPNGHVEDPNPFDPAMFRISQDFAASTPVKTQVTEIAVGRPTKQEFIRVHPSQDYRLDVAIVEYDRKTYLVYPRVAEAELRDQVSGVTLFTVVNTQGVVYLWPVPLPKDGRANAWTDSARALAMHAMTQTLQIKANHNPKAGRYDGVVPQGTPPEPKWPDMPFSDLLKLAFGSDVIMDANHPVVQKLLGINFD